jgi:hypothetical protein
MFLISAQKFSKDLGYGMSISIILSCVALTLCIFFYLYVVGSFLEIAIYPLINRVTFYAVFQEHVISEYFDNLIVIAAATSWFLLSINNNAIRYSVSIAYGANGIILAAISPDSMIFGILTLLSLPLIISAVLYHYKQQQKKNILNFNAHLTFRYISIVVIVISTLGIVFPALSIFLAPALDAYGGINHSNELFLLLSSFSTVYIFLFIFCLPVKVVFKEVLRMLKLILKEDIGQQIPSNNYEQNSSSRRLNTQTKIGFLLLAMIISVILVLIPQHPSINKENQDIGVDTSQYVTWIGELAKSRSISDFAYQAFIVQAQDGDRPLSLIFMFLVYHVAGGDLSEVIEYFPVILGPGIVLAFYFLTLELTRNERIALIAAFLGAVSFHTLVGIYAGFYANWLALVLGYVSIVFLFRYLRSGRVFDIVVFSTLLIGVLFFHVYTWTVLSAVVGIFLLTMLVIKNKKKNNNSNNYFPNRRIIWLLIFAILPSIVVDVTKVLLTGSSGGIEQDIELAQTGLGIEQFNLRWEILNITMHHSLGGVFSNFIILTLGLFWVLKSNMREPGTVFLIIFLSAGIVPLFFGSWGIQARVFYDIPFEIPAAIALYYISRRSGSILVTLAACTWLVAVSLFTVINYYLVPVQGMQ